MRFGHERLAARLANDAGLHLPSNVSREKLEEAYGLIAHDYVWALKKRPGLI
jgi:hypothetical protein